MFSAETTQLCSTRSLTLRRASWGGGRVSRGQAQGLLRPGTVLGAGTLSHSAGQRKSREQSKINEQGHRLYLLMGGEPHCRRYRSGRVERCGHLCSVFGTVKFSFLQSPITTVVHSLDQSLTAHCTPGPVLEAEERQTRAKTRVRGVMHTLWMYNLKGHPLGP